MNRRNNDLDEAIVKLLRQNGRISHQALATKLDVSRPAAGRHLNHLLTSGGTRVVGVVHPTVQGTTFMGHTSVTTDHDPQELAERIAEFDEVVFVSITAGAMPLVAEIRTRSREQFQASIDRVKELPGVISTDTVLYSEILLDVLEPRYVDLPQIDPVDERIMQQLQLDGRTSFSRLAALCGIGVASARSRTLRLLESGVVRLGVIRDLPGSDNRMRLGIGVKLRGRFQMDISSLQLPNAQFITRSLGRYDLILTLNALTRDETVEALAVAWSLPNVLHIDSWVHLRSVKERY